MECKETVSKSNQYEKIFMIALAAIGILICVTQKDNGELASPTCVVSDTVQPQQQQQTIQLR